MGKKWITDLAMTVLLLLLMAYSLVGEVLHEWMGIAMLVLFPSPPYLESSLV